MEQLLERMWFHFSTSKYTVNVIPLKEKWYGFDVYLNASVLARLLGQEKNELKSLKTTCLRFLLLPTSEQSDSMKRTKLSLKYFGTLNLHPKQTRE